MPIILAPPTCVPVTHRAAALARGDGESRLSVPLASAGPQPGDLKRTVIYTHVLPAQQGGRGVRSPLDTLQA